MPLGSGTRIAQAVLAALIAAGCQTPTPPDALPLWERAQALRKDALEGDGATDAELRAFAEDAWAYADAAEERWLEARVLYWVEFAVDAHGDKKAFESIYRDNFARLRRVIDGDWHRTRIALIGLGHLTSRPEDCRREAELKLALLDGWERETAYPPVRAVIPLRRISLYTDLDRIGLLREEEREIALEQIRLATTRSDVLPTYWSRGLERRFAIARGQLLTTKVGTPAPPLAGPTLDGGRFDLMTTRGKVALVKFWGFW